MLANFPKATWGAYREWWQERETRAAATATTDALGKTCEDLCARVKASIGESDLSRQLESFFSGGTMLRRARATPGGARLRPSDAARERTERACRLQILGLTLIPTGTLPLC